MSTFTMRWAPDATLGSDLLFTAAYILECNLYYMPQSAALPKLLNAARRIYNL